MRRTHRKSEKIETYEWFQIGLGPLPTFLQSSCRLFPSVLSSAMDFNTHVGFPTQVPVLYRISIENRHVVQRAPFQEPLLSAKERRRRYNELIHSLEGVMRHQQYLMGGCDDESDDAGESLDRQESALLAELAALCGTGCFRRGAKFHGKVAKFHGRG